jgi:predicted enzyme related to lactoylglutathione lyase
MNFSLKRINVINVFAEDLAGTKSFYQEVLGIPMTFEDENSAVFKLENLMISVWDVSVAHTLIAPTAVASPEAGARCVFSMFVDDVGAACAELVQHGVVLLNGPVDRPWGVRTASFTDPAGNIWAIGQDLG